MKNFVQTTTSLAPFEETLKKLKDTISKNGFTILHEYDIQSLFASKGIKHGKYSIIEFCRAPIAKQVLDSEPLAGICLPCRIIVFEKEETIVVSSIKPTLIQEFFPNSNLEDVVKPVSKDIETIIQSIK